MKSTSKKKKWPTKTLALPVAQPVDLPGAPDGVRFTETGLIVEKKFTPEAWNDLGKKLLLANRASKWWLGDWMTMGPNAAKFTAAMDQMGKQRKSHRRIAKGFCVEIGLRLGVSPGHVSNVACVCRRVPLKYREGMTVGHATEILLHVPDKDLPIWRDRVIREKLSVRELRIKLRQSLRTERPSPPHKTPKFFMEEVGEFARKFMAESESFTPGEWEAHKLTLGAVIKALHQNCQ